MERGVEDHMDARSVGIPQFANGQLLMGRTDALDGARSYQSLLKKIF